MNTTLETSSIPNHNIIKGIKANCGTCLHAFINGPTNLSNNDESPINSPRKKPVEAPSRKPESTRFKLDMMLLVRSPVRARSTSVFITVNGGTRIISENSCSDTALCQATSTRRGTINARSLSFHSNRFNSDLLIIFIQRKNRVHDNHFPKNPKKGLSGI